MAVSSIFEPEKDKIYRVEIPVLVDIKAKTQEDAIMSAISDVVDKGYGLGTQEIKVNYKTVVDLTRTENGTTG
jgi:hypothetical protein